MRSEKYDIFRDVKWKRKLGHDTVGKNSLMLNSLNTRKYKLWTFM